MQCSGRVSLWIEVARSEEVAARKIELTRSFATPAPSLIIHDSAVALTPTAVSRVKSRDVTSARRQRHCRRIKNGGGRVLGMQSTCSSEHCVESAKSCERCDATARCLPRNDHNNSLKMKVCLSLSRALEEEASQQTSLIFKRRK